MGISDLTFRRRGLAGAAAAAAAATAVPDAGAPAVAATDRQRLRREAGGVDALDLALAPLAGRRTGGPLRTPVVETTRFSMLGVTWRGGDGRVRARWRRAGRGWTSWREVPGLCDGPDRRTAEGRRTPAATDLVWVGASDAVQVELTGDQAEPVLTLVQPRRRTTDAAAADTTAGTTDVTDGTDARGRADGWLVPKPDIRSRRQWGADPDLRDGQPQYNRSIRQVHVHHTVNSNDYSRGQVPGLIRGMYRYHTVTLGWSDIGYNFLVDRFGRIWTGRAGGVRRPVRGAHTLGFNHSSTGVAVIGNFVDHDPNRTTLNAVARLAAWKLDRYDRNPRGKIRVRSWGSDKYAAGRWVRLPVIDGHRDTNDTACPGDKLYARLPRIRRRAARRIRKFHDQ